MAEGNRVTLYHYTDGQSKHQILQSGHIKQSDGVHGRGVYMTKIPPSQGKAAVSRNNYDSGAGGYWEHRESKGSADYAFKVKVPADKLHKEPTGPGGRSVYHHKGDLKLSNHPHSVQKVGGGGGGGGKGKGGGKK